MKCLGLNKAERGTNITNNEINTCRVVPGDETENSIHGVHCHHCFGSAAVYFVC